jgi:hypothetical protein
MGKKRVRSGASSRQIDAIMLGIASVLDPTGTAARRASESVSQSHRSAITGRYTAKAATAKTGATVTRAWENTGRLIRNRMTGTSQRQNQR